MLASKQMQFADEQAELISFVMHRCESRYEQYDKQAAQAHIMEALQWMLRDWSSC